MLHSSKIRLLVVHCSDTDNDLNLNSIDIHQMHLNFGWDGIGYHKIILRSGRIENGRPEFWVGAHVKGINKISLGVCLIGRDKFTDKQFSSLQKVLKDWRLKYPKSTIIGHKDNDDTNKTCPNFDVISWARNKNL